MEESVYQARWLLIIMALLVVAMTTVGAAAG
jgi:cytochrome c biogenesis protein ResB